MSERTLARRGVRTMVDDPYDDDAADDKDRDRDRLGDRAARVSVRAGCDVDAEPSVESPEADRCHRELRARDLAGEGPPVPAGPDRPQLTQDGGWKWKGLELGPEAHRIATEEIAARRAAEGRDTEGNYGEGGITPAMRRIEADLEHGWLAPDTEKLALKSPDRFKEKLAKLIKRYPDQPYAELASSIPDGIRCTFLFATEDYTTGVKRATQLLNDNGYDHIIRRPSWDKIDYRGVNSRWRDIESGVLFEVQYHTPESWEAKQKTHDIYEKLCDLRISPKERKQLEEQQRLVTATIPIPPGVEDITYYEKGQPSNRD